MNYLDHDESDEWNDDISSFEEKLRSLSPTAPEKSWDAVVETIEMETAPVDRPAVVSGVPATSFWKPVISHAVTAALGLMAGVAVMLAQRTNQPASVSKVVAQDEKVEAGRYDDPRADKTQPEILERENETVELVTQRRFLQSGSRSGTLRAFGPNFGQFAQRDGWLLRADREEFSRLGDPVAEEGGTLSKPAATPSTPVLSPRSFDSLLYELSSSPTPDSPTTGKRLHNYKWFKS